MVGALRSEIDKLVRSYLQAAGGSSVKDTSDGTPDDTEPLNIFMWASVHDSCMSHLAHTHPNTTVSGVYYVSVPPGSGDLIFEDPRGALPPFGNRHIVKPRAGQVVLFPSWLVHAVAPSCGLAADNPRISLSFNVIGDWARTNDATALLFDLEDTHNSGGGSGRPGGGEL